jgi:wyosine [tRNA(Phe)-imidazoG37] synthetase (radical SAM superfamily)
MKRIMEIPEPSTPDQPLLAPHRDHSRLYQLNRFVYPVLSRRSRGLSLGINLNPDKACNFDCIYCQVDRHIPPETREVDPELLVRELEGMLDLVESGEIYRDERFSGVPGALRRLNDVAFSGDGEPTTCPEFPRIVADVAATKERRGLDRVKLVLITNATMLHRPRVRQALQILDENQGEIWAKLDAGTPAYFREVDRTSIPFARILANLLDAARVRPIVIQSLFMTVSGRAPGEPEIDAYCRRLAEIRAGGGAIASVQVYTVARPPAEQVVGPLSGAELEKIAEVIRERVGLQVEVFGGSCAAP